MASQEVWRDFEQIRDAVAQRFTVDKLKVIINALNDECNAALAKTGKKQDLINRLVIFLTSLKNNRMEDKWQSAKAIINQVRNNGVYSPPVSLPTVALPASFGGAGTTYPASSGFKTGSYHSLNGGTSSNTLHRYDPYAPPQSNGATASTSAASTSSRPIGIRFRDSPFFTVDQAVSLVVECPESNSGMDRRQQTLTFTLTNDQLAKLKAPGSLYQLRLFCTSSIYYSPANRQSNYPCPVEFPPTCEVRVNNAQVTANLKGLKKKPGTAPPPDLAKYVRLTTQLNRIEMVYVNSAQPFQAKKYYLVVMLVEATTVHRLVDNLKANCRRSSEEIKEKMKESMIDDDDIQAGSQKMSLKCPLSFMRVVTPCRSSKCVHPQCFDATSWFAVMEQTTTYLCPTCEQILNHKDLIIDGYFEEILNRTDEDVEDVIVEADGEWHTADNQYGSVGWRAQVSADAKPVSPVPESKPDVSITNGVDNDKGKARNFEVFVLSDDEDEDAVKKELSPSYRSLDSLSVPSQSIRSQSNALDDVIDLTLLSDDDDPPARQPPLPQPQPQSLKRKATDVELPPIDTWKKSRGRTQTPLPGALPLIQPLHPQSENQQPVISPVYRTPTASSLDFRNREFDHNQRPPPPTLPSINGYSQQTQSTYVNYPGRPSLTESRQLPPPSVTASYQRGNPARWPGP